MHFWKAGLAVLACGTAVQATVAADITALTGDVTKLTTDINALSNPPTLVQALNLLGDVTTTTLHLATLVTDLVTNPGDLTAAVTALQGLCDTLPALFTALVNAVLKLTGPVATVVSPLLKLALGGLADGLDDLITLLNSVPTVPGLSQVITCLTDALKALDAAITTLPKAKMIRSAGATIPLLRARVPIAAY